MRSYIRLDPHFPDRKEQYPDGALAALPLVFCYAEQQPERGRFKPAVLRALLGKRAKWIRYLLEQRDLVELDDGRLYLDGWDEWQEGDWKVAERMRRVRERPRNARDDADRNIDRIGPVDALAVGGRRQAVGTKPRASGDGGAAAGAVRSHERPTKTANALDLPLTEAGQHILAAYELITGRQPTDHDRGSAADFDVQLIQSGRMTLDQVTARMHSLWTWCTENSKPYPKSLGGFWPSLRHEADHISDAKSSTSARKRVENGAPTSIGDVLGGTNV